MRWSIEFWYLDKIDELNCKILILFAKFCNQNIENWSLLFFIVYRTNVNVKIVWLCLTFGSQHWHFTKFHINWHFDSGIVWQVRIIFSFYVGKECTTDSFVNMNRSFLAPLQFQKQFVRNLLQRQQPNKKHIYKKVGNGKRFGCIDYYAKWVFICFRLGFTIWIRLKKIIMEFFISFFTEMILKCRNKWPNHQNCSACNVLRHWDIEIIGNDESYPIWDSWTT